MQDAPHSTGGKDVSIINRAVVVASALALACAPAAFAKGGPPSSPGGDSGNPPQAQHGKGHAKPKKVVAKGTVVSYDATAGTLVVHVTKANHHGAGMVGTDVSFDVRKAKLSGTPAAGDKVVVQTVNVAAADGRFPARHVVDQTHPPQSDSTDSTDSPGSTDDQTSQD
jgi:hypothetical protein